MFFPATLLDAKFGWLRVSLLLSLQAEVLWTLCKESSPTDAVSPYPSAPSGDEEQGAEQPPLPW